MLKADLHVHSKYSSHPSEWFLQRLGTAESYTELEYIYQTAKNRGMNLVTITDHNTIDGSLLLHAQHPKDTFVSVETTSYFPEDHCKIHILLFDITEKEFAMVQKLRHNIYELRDFIRENQIAYSVAHATYSVNNTIKVEHLEKLILLFDIFESINGMRNKRGNLAWTDTLKDLTPNDFERLYEKHRLQPFSRDPWIKGFTGGSDDHAGLFIARTYTVADACSREQFLSCLRNKNTYANGRHNDYQSLALSFYKIAYDFVRNKTSRFNSSTFNLINSFIFDNRRLGLKELLIMKKLKTKNGHGTQVKKYIAELMDELKEKDIEQIEAKFSIVYQKVGHISDEIIKGFLNSLADTVSQGELTSLLNNVSLLLTSIFLCAPFVTTLFHMHQSRELVPKLMKNLGKKESQKQKKILWFTDKLFDLNGVSVTLREIGWAAHHHNQNLKIVTSLLPEEVTSELPPFVLKLDNIFTMPLPLYEKYILRFPAILKSLEEIYACDPDIIYISTPGPIGLLGKLAASLLHVPAIGIYHTDYPEQVQHLMQDISLSTMVKNFEKWFYNSLDMIYTSTQAYMEILADRGFEEKKLKLLPRGIDNTVFDRVPHSLNYMQEHYAIPAGINLLYAGRISQDKSVDLVLDIYLELAKKYENFNLIFVGDGPYAETMQKTSAPCSHIFWLGAVDNRQMPVIYSAADLLIFPSTTDTFGRVVAEAQCCGLPVVVSDVGGSKEIIKDKETGFIVPSQDPQAWVEQVEQALEMLLTDPAAFKAMQRAARERAVRLFPFQRFFDEIMNCPTEGQKKNSPRTTPDNKEILESYNKHTKNLRGTPFNNQATIGGEGRSATAIPARN